MAQTFVKTSSTYYVADVEVLPSVDPSGGFNPCRGCICCQITETGSAALLGLLDSCVRGECTGRRCVRLWVHRLLAVPAAHHALPARGDLLI